MHIVPGDQDDQDDQNDNHDQDDHDDQDDQDEEDYAKRFFFDGKFSSITCQERPPPVHIFQDGPEETV